MRERGFLEENIVTAEDAISKHADLPLVTLYSEELISHAIVKMRKFNISQIPVLRDGEIVGSLSDTQIYRMLVENPELKDTAISKVMSTPFPVVKATTKLEDVAKLINEETQAVIVELKNGDKQILTRQDIIASLA
jgi:cystathionine beta-synthase